MHSNAIREQDNVFKIVKTSLGIDWDSITYEKIKNNIA